MFQGCPLPQGSCLGPSGHPWPLARDGGLPTEARIFKTGCDPVVSHETTAIDSDGIAYVKKQQDDTESTRDGVVSGSSSYIFMCICGCVCVCVCVRRAH